MSRNQIQQGVVILLLVVFVALWSTLRKGPAVTPSLPLAGGPARPSEPASPKPETAPAEPAAPLITLVRDPFRLPAELLERIRQKDLEKQHPPEPLEPETPSETEPAPAVELPSLELQGVFWGIPSPQAIINRKIVSVGDQIEGVRIVSISRDGVVVSLNGQDVTLAPPAPGSHDDSGTP